MLTLFLLLSFFILPNQSVYAADTAVRVVSVEYYEEQLIVLNNGNSRIYLATEAEAAKNNWEVITPDPGDYTMIDISWLSPTVDNVLFVKGDKDATKSRIEINKRPLKLEVTLNYSKLEAMNDNDTIADLVNIMSTTGTGKDPVDFDDLEWRKGTTGQWKSTRTLTVGLFEKYLSRGTDLYFRIRALDDHVTIKNGSIDLNRQRAQGLNDSVRNYSKSDLGTDYPNGSEGRRFSSEVKVKVAKKAPAAVTGVDGSKFTAQIKYGKEYRVTIDGVTSNWVKVTDRTVTNVKLSEIVNKGNIDGTTKDRAFPKMTIEVREYSTAKTSASKITEISLEAQRKLENDIVLGKAPANAITNGDENIYLYYNGDKNIVLTIPTASTSLPYEYCVVKNGESLNMSKASWTSITKGTEVKILSSKAVQDGTLYVRQKEIKYKKATNTSAAVGFQLASTYVTHKISYPTVPEIKDETFIFTKGFTGDISFKVKLNSAGKTPFETAVKSIKLGTKDIDFTTSTETVDGVSTMTVTLKADSLKNMANCSVKPITITFANGTVNKSAIRLTIQNPTAAGTLTLTTAKGTNAGTTSFTVTTTKAVDSKWAYVITSAALNNVYTSHKISDITSETATEFTSAKVDNITITATPTQYITVFELDKDGYIIKYKSIEITSAMIK